jgi:hypothetical protein
MTSATATWTSSWKVFQDTCHRSHQKGQLDEYLTADHILSRIKEHFITCATSVELSDEASIARVSSCVKALVLIFQYSRERKKFFRAGQTQRGVTVTAENTFKGL